MASQDRNLQASLRKVPGRCLLYLHKAAPVLEAPSDASKKWVQKKARNLLPQEAEKKIEYLKQKEGLVKKENELPKRKPKGPKNPNPLSCKKSKKQKQLERQQQQKQKEHKIAETSKTEMKPKRKRIKLPAHVKEALKNKD